MVRAQAEAQAQTAKLYAAYGSVIESDIALPRLARAPRDEPCLRIQRQEGDGPNGVKGTLVYQLDGEAGEVVYRLALSRARYLWSYPRIGDFSVNRDGRVVQWTAPKRAVQDAAVALAGPILGFAFQLQGRTSLHGSAVMVDGGAVGLLGPSGHGKSTLAAALLNEGCRLLTDDALMLQLEPEGPLVWPGTPTMKLWPDVLSRVVPPTKHGALPRHISWADKRVVSVEEMALGRAEAQPLRLLFVLSPSAPDSRVEVRRLHGREALLALVGMGYNSQLLAKEPQLLSAQLKELSRVVETVPVHVVSCPRSLDRLGEVAEAVLEESRRSGP